MKGFVLVVAVLAVFDLIIDMLLVDGKMKNIVKSMVALVSFYVMIEALISLINFDF